MNRKELGKIQLGVGIFFLLTVIIAFVTTNLFYVIQPLEIGMNDLTQEYDASGSEIDLISHIITLGTVSANTIGILIMVGICGLILSTILIFSGLEKIKITR